jgi:diacylglycerol kinase
VSVLVFLVATAIKAMIDVCWEPQTFASKLAKEFPVSALMAVQYFCLFYWLDLVKW